MGNNFFPLKSHSVLVRNVTNSEKKIGIISRKNPILWNNSQTSLRMDAFSDQNRMGFQRKEIISREKMNYDLEKWVFQKRTRNSNSRDKMELLFVFSFLVPPDEQKRKTQTKFPSCLRNYNFQSDSRKSHFFQLIFHFFL